MTQRLIGRVLVEPDDPCAECGKRLDVHEGTAYHVDGLPVGNADCARRLHERRHPVCVYCGTPVDRVCEHIAAGLAAAARAPQFFFHVRSSNA